MKSLHTLAVPLVLAGLLFAGHAHSAEDDPFKKRLLPVELVMSFRSEIGLTKNQRNEIGKMVVQTQQSVAEKQWQMQSDYFELIAELDKPKIDEDTALALAKSAVDAENAIKIEQVRLLIRLRNLLEPEQISFLREQLNKGWSAK
jgi:Spy/CpxP family protein refolding chaperone